MPIYVDILNKFLSVFTILLQVIIVFISINILFFSKKENFILSFLKRYTYLLGFLAGLGAIMLSLIYSEVIGFPACELCILQRVFLYPQLVFFGIGFYRKIKQIMNVSLVFSILGSIVSIYHIYIENGGASNLVCALPNTTDVGKISCATRYVFEFGYITIPVMCLTLSLFIILLIVNNKKLFISPSY